MTYEENYLAHYGVRGQKWGVRKYQNEDGSLTQLGKEHYSTVAGGNEKFDKSYKKEFKKYKKLSDRADIDTQKQAAEKHDARAKTAAKIGAAAGLAAASILGVDSKISGQIQNMNTADRTMGLALKNNRDLLNVERGLDRRIFNRNGYFRNVQPYLGVASVVASAASVASFGTAEEHPNTELSDKQIMKNLM